MRRFFEPCDLEIWRMTLKNNRAPLLCYFKLGAAFRTHWWIQTGVTAVFSQYVKVGGDLLKVGGDSSSAKRCGAATPRRGGGFPLPLVGVRGASPGKFLQKWKSNTAIWCILRDNFMFHHWFFTGIDEQVCFNFSPKQKLERCTIYIFNEWLILCTNSNWQSYQNLKLEGTCFTAPKPTWQLKCS